MKETGVTGYWNKTYCQANKSSDELIDVNTENTKHLDLGLKSQKKIPEMHKNPTGVRFIIPSKTSSLQSKFLNLFQMFLSSYTPKLKIFIKMLNYY